MMIDAVMYGVMLSAKMDMFVKELPVIVLKKLNAVAVWLLHHSLTKAVFTPGVGTWLPSRTMTIIKNVKSSFLRISTTFNALRSDLNILFYLYRAAGCFDLFLCTGAYCVYLNCILASNSSVA